MPRADYEFLTTWRVPGTLEEVARVLSEGEELPRWWPSVYLGVDVLAEGAPEGAPDQGVGARAVLHTKGWLPYTLTWTLEIVEPVTTHGYVLTADGDLVGTGRWSFRQDGPEVVVDYDWQVSASKPLLHRLTWLLRPVFERNHHWAMARGQESLALELRRRRARTDAERAAVPAPPGPTFVRLTRLLSRRE